MAPPPNRPPVRRPPAAPRPPARSDTEPSQPAIDPQELSTSTRRRVARRPKEEPKKKSKLPLVLVLLLLGGVGAAGYWKMTQKPPPPPTIDPSIEQRKQLQALFQEGKNLVRQGKWVEAKAKFQAVIDAEADFGDGAVKTYLAAAEKEIPNQQFFDAAAAALDKGELGNAHRALQKVSADTQQLQRREDLQNKLEAAFKQKLVEAQGLARGDSASMKKLKALAEDLLVVKPEDRDALEYKATADRALRGTKVVEAPIAKDDPGLEVRQRYVNGDASGAFAAAQACAGESNTCKDLQDKMSDLNALLKKLETMQIGELENAQRLERAISGGKPTPQGRPIGTRIAAWYYPKASAAKVQGNWVLAMQNALKVIDADPAHTGGQAIVNEGRERARELYLRCYQQKIPAPEEATPLCNEVVQMLPPGDPQRVKAEGVLESMKTR